MTKFEFEDETYYINGESVYDSHFIAVSADVAVRVIGAYFETIDYKNMSEDELVDFVRYIYKLKAYYMCEIGVNNLINVLIEKCGFREQAGYNNFYNH